MEPHLPIPAKSMPEPHLIVLRHGRSVANDQGVIASRLEHAGEAYGLTSSGRDQLRRSVQDALSQGSLRAPFSLLCSPLLRARESAEVAAGLLGVAPSVDERLAERDFGALELGPDTEYARVWEADREDPTHRRWGVESVVDVLRRAGSVVEDHASRGDVATVLLVTHGDVASTLLCASEGIRLGLHREVGALETAELRALASARVARDNIISSIWAARVAP